MIILDHDIDPARPESPNKQNPLPQTPLRAVSPPPTYGVATYSRGPSAQSQPFAGSRPPFAAASAPPPPPPPTTVAFGAGSPPRQSAGRRFFEAFGVALLIWILVVTFTRSLELNIGHHGISGSIYPIPNGVRTMDCIDSQDAWGSHGLHSTSYELPLSSDTLFLLSKGVLSRGTLEVSTEQSGKDTSVARVEVSVEYNDASILDHIQVCRLSRGDGENGVGIFSPNAWWRVDREKVRFNVKLVLPALSPRLNIHTLETDMANFQQILGDFSELVHFENLRLKSTNGRIAGQYVTCDACAFETTNDAVAFARLGASKQARISSTNGPIRGHYSSDNDLILRTTNGPIEVEAQFGGKIFDASTTNSRLEANVIATGSKPTIRAATSNGPLHLAVQEMPVGAALTLNAETSNNAARVSLPATYEGAFLLSTTNQALYVTQREVKDPEGKGRQRTVTQNRVSAKGFIKGDVYWSPSSRSRGNVDVKSTNAKVFLEV
ncbi:hypothetical protein CYLTODRAFT_488491 [Cylindrobasidium torrendii FP15055 ss-10]|uniref:DUF7330 domain-containing protein n=1 Tax=Cylindrobasidium torrendii FP15055 ss-10 TaxID=1314674 RepID=A0A0D7BIV5_9AGAR|nr:hypothetical protein CYLTODRAFT_488491 [Cylindrobasidium torrendii FP15055 ss-10]